KRRSPDKKRGEPFRGAPWNLFGQHQQILPRLAPPPAAPRHPARSSIRPRIRPLRGRLAPPKSIPQGLLRNKFDERRDENSWAARRNRNRQIRLLDPRLRLQKRAG